MKLVSANIGLLREVTWQGRSVTAAIGKQQVEGRIALCKPNLDGNRHVYLSVHGERTKPPSAI
jgi:MOSC domain-containing protein YiiM